MHSCCFLCREIYFYVENRQDVTQNYMVTTTDESPSIAVDGK